jgi:hypothetical protein
MYPPGSAGDAGRRCCFYFTDTARLQATKEDALKGMIKDKFSAVMDEGYLALLFGGRLTGTGG